MALRLAGRLDALQQSEIRNMSIECARVGGINLSQGVCNTEVPIEVRRAAAEAIEAGANIYSRYDGAEELRRALSRKMREHNGLDYDPEGEIIVTVGATGAFYVAALAFLEPGDEVILFEPYYGYHVNTLRAVQAVPVYVDTEPPDWCFDPAALEAAISPRTRGIMVNTPQNPSGKVFERSELEMIADLARSHDLFLFTDEVYEHFLFDGREHLSPATFPDVRERTITMNALSKTFAITGWRLGWIAADRRWARAFGPLSDLVYVCPPTPLQLGAARGLELLGADYYDGIRVEYQEKRDRICASLERAGLSPWVPQGSYYVLADISRLPGQTSKERAMALLRETGVACVPGEAFFRGSQGHRMGRFCFGLTDEDLAEACRRLEKLA
ncbi:MAG: pyridoxal phosphate-dependent aminotransferase [Myxococcota bacterium]|nr:pyridoxal phosphate-dependent aminotransferase [Myxococcota bacterium]